MYNVYWVGGKRDGELLWTADSAYQATVFAENFYAEHEDEFDPVCGGVTVLDSDGDIIW